MTESNALPMPSHPAGSRRHYQTDGRERVLLVLALAGVEILPLLLVAAAYLFTVGVSIYWQARYRREG